MEFSQPHLFAATDPSPPHLSLSLTSDRPGTLKTELLTASSLSYFPSARQQAETQEFIKEIYLLNPTCTRYYENAELDKEAAWGYKQFMMFEGYRNYREKQPGEAVVVIGKNGKQKREVKWLDDMEFAFWKALIVFPPRGRKQWKYPRRYSKNQDPNAKEELKGRNELIAMLIEQWTGDVIGRKNVSSHIQVLRNYVLDSEMAQEAHKLATELKWFGPHKAKSDKRGVAGATTRHIASGRERSRYVERPLTPNASRPQLPLPALGSPFSMDRLPSTGAPRHSFEPHGFAMYVKDGFEVVTGWLTRLQTPNSRLPDLPSSSTEDLFPPISTVFHDNENGSPEPDCQLLLANSTMSISEESLRGTELAIDFSISTDVSLAQYHKFECRTRFFSRNQDNPCLRHFHKGNNVTKAVAYDYSERVLKPIPFGSEFWATCAHGFAKKLGEAGRLRIKANMASDAKDAATMRLTAQKLQMEVCSSISGLTAVQEIFASGPQASSTRLLVIYWEFQQALPGRPGETTWRHINSPSDADSLDMTSPTQTLVKSISASFPGASAPSSSMQRYTPFLLHGTNMATTTSYPSLAEQQQQHHHHNSFAVDDAHYPPFSSWPTSAHHTFSQSSVTAGAPMSPPQPNLMPDYRFQITIDTGNPAYFDAQPAAGMGADNLSPEGNHVFGHAWNSTSSFAASHGLGGPYFDASASAGMMDLPAGVTAHGGLDVGVSHHTVVEHDELIDTVESEDSPDVGDVYTPLEHGAAAAAALDMASQSLVDSQEVDGHAHEMHHHDPFAHHRQQHTAAAAAEHTNTCADHELYAVQEFNNHAAPHHHSKEELDLIQPPHQQHVYDDTHHVYDTSDSQHHHHHQHDVYEPHAHHVFAHDTHLAEAQGGACEEGEGVGLARLSALEQALGLEGVPAKL